MSLTIVNSSKPIKTETLIIGTMENHAPQGLNEGVDQQISDLIRLGDLTGKKGEITILYPSQQAVKRVILCGLGSETKVNLEVIRQATAQALKKAEALKCKNVMIDLESFLVGELDMQAVAQAVGLTATLNQYHYDTYKPEKDHRLAISLSFSKPQQIRQAVQTGMAIGEGANFARDLGDRPPNTLYPEQLAREAQRMCRQYPKLSIKIIKKPELEKAGFGGLLAVGQGSKRPPVFIEITYRGGKAGAAPIALVGKGITFDSGGLSLKPGERMDEMRFDMCGAAAVLGIMQAAAATNLKQNLVAMISSAENMPGGNAYRPGDVVTTLSGKTIEVLNTDAEGRIILADALTMAVKRRPSCIIDFATLTGAVIIALGHIASGLMSNRDTLATSLIAAGQASGDKVWQLPLWDDYRDLISSDKADVANMAKERGAGTIAAAAFLEKFVNDIPWAHLDIAGTAWGQTNPIYGKGVTGAGVRLVMTWLLNPNF